MISDKHFFIFGLGNPGPNYHWTRHNIGFLCLDQFAAQCNKKFAYHRQHNADVAHLVFEDFQFILVKPLTFMNKSGVCVRSVLGGEIENHSKSVVIADDLNLDFGCVRLKLKGSAGRHNGLKSVEHAIGTRDYPRLKIGISHPTKNSQTKPPPNVINYVLDSFTELEKKQLPQIYDHAFKGLLTWATEGASQAMNFANKKLF
jgi:PTH1 family peptidyl-tRNA hydrolase